MLKIYVRVNQYSIKMKRVSPTKHITTVILDLNEPKDLKRYNEKAKKNKGSL